MRIVFMGTPEFAVPPLEHLVINQYQVVAVYTQPDKPAGRGRSLVATPAKRAALSLGLPVLQPVSLRGAEAVSQLADFHPDVIVVAAFGQILPTKVLDIPRYGCINVHPSLLPRFRGASPVASAILAGDEFGRSQGGNNNAYCQDNDISWLDWNLLDENRDLFDFFKGMITLRKSCTQLRQNRFFGQKTNKRGLPEVGWHGCELNAPGWQDPSCQVLAFTLGAIVDKEMDLHIMMNMGEASLPFQIPALKGRRWYRYTDTALATDSAVDTEATTLIDEEDYLVTGRSIVILISR